MKGRLFSSIRPRSIDPLVSDPQLDVGMQFVADDGVAVVGEQLELCISLREVKDAFVALDAVPGQREASTVHP